MSKTCFFSYDLSTDPICDFMAADPPPSQSAVNQNLQFEEYYIVFDVFESSFRNDMKEILLEIGFIEEMRTIRGNKKLTQTFFHVFFHPLKYI